METGRFWASRARLEGDGEYHIRHVIGPDEYHEDVDDNAYTDLLAAWNLNRGVEAARWLAERWPEAWNGLAARLRITPEEIASWKTIAARMHFGFDPKTRLFEQHQGYFGLEAIDLAAYEPRHAAMDVILGHARILQTNVVKQADVVMALHLLWNDFPAEVRAANFRYYEPHRTRQLFESLHSRPFCRQAGRSVPGRKIFAPIGRNRLGQQHG